MKSRIPKVLLFSFIVSLGFLGAAIGNFTTHAEATDRYSDLQMFTKVLNLVEQHYVEEVDTKKLIYGGIKGMLASLDPHTNFLPPDIFSEFKVETTGEFGGIGIEISVQDDILTVISPIDDTPAFKAGIKAGDKIVEIEGKSTKGMTLAEAVEKMRGKRGKPASITIYREGFTAPKKFTIAREIIKVKSIKYTDLKDGYGYLRITSFIEHTGEDLKAAIAAHEKSGKTKGLVLDLRNNAGGLLDQAIEVCNTFINDGIIVSTIGRNKKDKDVVYAHKDGARTDFPIIVLMNEYSASASEIVAGALQDHKRAIIMGTRSFGKGSVQSVVELGDGAGLKLTVARYYTPSGRSIQAQGIEPDINLDPVDMEAYRKSIIHRKALREADMENHLVNDTTVADPSDDKKTTIDEFWKKEKLTEKDAKAKEEAEEAKLSPADRLLKKDYQVAQALNYLKAGTLIKGEGASLSNQDDRVEQKPLAKPSLKKTSQTDAS